MVSRDKDRVEQVRDVVEAARKPGHNKAGHSPLYVWLWSNHADLVSDLSAPATPNWKEIAATLGRLGVLDGTGKTPSANTTRNAWWRVCRDKASGPKTRKPRGRTKKAAKAPAPSAPAEPEAAPAAAPVHQPAEGKYGAIRTPLKRSWEK